MKKIIVSVCLFSLVFLAITAFQDKTTPRQWDENATVFEVLFSLGEPKPTHFITPTAKQIAQGEEIVKLGFTKDDKGRKTRQVSKHYVCTTCHNLQQEDPIPAVSDPETRLTYAKEHNIPFLQGTTFWGIVNRESWYNDDYVKKYGDEKIKIAHKSLRESIQLCAIECSQGRPMEGWEIEAVLAYYWSLQLKMKDLPLTETDWKKINTTANKIETKDWLKTKYAVKSPATFFDAPKSKKDGYQLKGRPEVGKDIYELSCLYCHKNMGVSHYILDDSKLSFQHLKTMMFRDSHFSIYQIIAYGTYAIPGYRPYMPHYPLERMSKQQVEDLRAYIMKRAKE
jgi:mono/diheme cytochrome c family protein/cytochrome c553